MEPSAIIDQWIASRSSVKLFPGLLRLARHVPEAQGYLKTVLEDPLDLALAGLLAPPQGETALDRRVLAALASIDGGVPLVPSAAAALERDAEGDPLWWVHAARVHVLSAESREREARSRLASQQLPYVFPGEIHPLMVDLLAAGDRVLPALHVDWVRKLTKWLCEDLIGVDCARLALWFWPVLGSLDPARLVRPLARISESDLGLPGSAGIAATYCHCVGGPGDLMLARCGPLDRLVLAMALAGMERRADQVG